MVTFQQRRDGLIEEIRATARGLMRPGAGSVRQRFVLFGRARTGSTLMVRMLDAHPDIACAGEIFRLPKLRPAAHVDAVLRGFSRPVRGFKLLSYQLREHFSDAQRAAFRDWLIAADVRVFHLQRDNLVRHAVSNLYAQKRGAYHSTSANAAQAPRIRVTPEEIFTTIKRSEANLAYEEAFLGDLPRLTLRYEADLAAPEHQGATLHRATAFLGLPPHTFTPDLRKVTPEDLAALIENYDEVAEALQAAGYGRFLPAA